MQRIENIPLEGSKMWTDTSAEDLIDQARVFQMLQSLVVAQVVLLATNTQKDLWKRNGD